MSVITVVRRSTADASAPRAPHPLLRATAWSSAIGLFTGLVLGAVTQVKENDRG